MRRQGRGLSGGALLLSCVGLALVVYAWLVRPDGLAWLTIWPVWLGLLPGLLLLIPAIVDRWRPGWVVACAWLLAVGLLSDELPALLRHGPPPAYDLRVVTLNCAAGQSAPVEALAAWQPDLVVLQEAPSARDCWTLAGRLWGRQAKARWALETAVLSRHRLTTAGSDPLCWSQVTMTLPDGRSVEALSLRLSPVPLCFNVFSARCRTGLIDNRVEQRQELSEVAARLDGLAGAAVIVAGDFNAPAGDAIMRVFPDWLHDSWRVAGRGWGNTCLGDLPTSRIDQIWVGGPLEPVSVRAVVVPGSDHRAVIADLVLRTE